jgi:glycosyl transferase family 25
MISFVGAKYLLAMSEKFGRPVDVDIQHWWENGLYILGMQPYPLEINHSMDIDIENKGARKNQKGAEYLSFISRCFSILEIGNIRPL